MKNLFLIALLAMLSALTAGIKLKNKVVQDPAGDPAGSGAGSGDPAGSTYDPTKAYLSKDAAKQLLDNIDASEAILRKFYHSTMGTDPYENVTCPVVEETYDCGGLFEGTSLNLMSDPVIDVDSSTVLGTKPNEEMQAYVDYAVNALQECADPETGSWDSNMTIGYKDPMSGYHTIRYGLNTDNTRNWNITLFKEDGSAGCLRIWSSPNFMSGYGYPGPMGGPYGYPMGGMGPFSTGSTQDNYKVLTTLCWDETGDCTEELEIGKF